MIRSWGEIRMVTLRIHVNHGANTGSMELVDPGVKVS